MRNGASSFRSSQRPNPEYNTDSIVAYRETIPAAKLDGHAVTLALVKRWQGNRAQRR